MSLANPVMMAFNRGLISRLGLARTDLKRTALSAETMTNWMPRSLGSMMLRPGFGYIGGTKSNARMKPVPFIAGTTDTAMIEITDSVMRVRISDTLITRPSVSAAVNNGSFDTNLTGWTDADESGATSDWLTGGYMTLTGTRFNAAIRRQQVTVTETGTEHALRIVINRGPVTIKVGSSSGGDQYVTETELGTGTHSLAFTPTGDFHVEFSSRRQAAVLVDSCTVEAAGTMEVTAPWAAADLSDIRYTQSGDVIFVACDGYQQRKIERRGTGRSWSIVLYEPEDGPFRIENTTTTRITPSGLTGSVTLTASSPLFRSSHVGALFRLTSVGQKVSIDANGAGQWSDAIRVVGVDSGRVFDIVITGTFTATVTLQRSIDDQSSWTDVTTWTGTVSTTHDDGLDNQIVYYRIGIDTGDYTSGTATASLTYGAGSLTGVVKVRAYSSSTSVTADVLTALGQTTAMEAWSEGVWSDFRGWPTAVSFYEGRLWWTGRDRFVGSISDAYASFDPDTEGDSGPINRSIGQGPVDVINWLLPLQRLIAGTDGSELSIRSTSFDEPLTPTNFNLKDASTQGSARVAAVKVDTRGVFIQRSGERVFLLEYDGASNDYAATDLTIAVPEIGEETFTVLAVQRQPDTRIHCVRDDGTVAVLVFDKAENVQCWVEVETDGEVEDVCVLPGTGEDAVYYVIKRTINGSDVRYLEKWALESECRGSTLNKQADSFITFTNSPASATVTGLSHLEGAAVVVWADGKCLRTSAGAIATFMVSSGQITLTNAGSSYSATTGIVGLAYTARFKSTKLAYAGALGTALMQKKQVNHLGVILADSHHKGLKYGPDFDNLDDLPTVEAGAEVATDTVWTAYDYPSFPFDGRWDTDSRVCLEASAPRPCTVLAAMAQLEVHEKA